MRMKLPVLLGVLVIVAACSKDTATLPTTSPLPTSIIIAPDSGVNNRTVTVHSTIPVKVHVTQNGSPLSGATVRWDVGTTNGSVSAPSSVTDASGAASVNWTLGDTARVYGLAATITGTTTASAQITATAVGGNASALSKVSPDSSAVVAGAALVLIARTSDKFGNGSPGIVINWTASGGTLTAASTTTGNAGNASVNFMTTVPGTYSVTASVPGIGSVTFKVVAL